MPLLRGFCLQAQGNTILDRSSSETSAAGGGTAHSRWQATKQSGAQPTARRAQAAGRETPVPVSLFTERADCSISFDGPRCALTAVPPQAC